MFDLESLIKIPHMATLISLVLGFGIAAIFRPLCKGPDCVILRGPPISEIRGAVYQFGTKCVEFVPKAVPCPADGRGVVETLSFAAAGAVAAS
jgi:hypothetical protein